MLRRLTDKCLVLPYLNKIFIPLHTSVDSAAALLNVQQDEKQLRLRTKVRIKKRGIETVGQSVESVQGRRNCKYKDSRRHEQIGQVTDRLPSLLAFPRLSGEHRTSEKSESWRRARSARRG